MKRIKHSKIKNTGILYELLMRQVSADVVSGNMDSKALSIVKEHFVRGTEIQKELELYQLLVNHKFNSESKANSLIEAVLSARVRLNSAKLRKSKYAIIKEINQSYNTDAFFGSNVPNYVHYASIYKLFEDKISGEPSDPLDLSKCKHTLVEHICGKSVARVDSKSKVLVEFERQPEDVRLLTTRLLVDGFNKKYSNLSTRQKSLLREFINDTQGSLKRHIEKEIPAIRKELTDLSTTVTDKVVKIKLTEVIKQLDRIVTKGRDVKDENVAALLGYYTLIDELRRLSNEKSK
jgi:hypothetical protein